MCYFKTQKMHGTLLKISVLNPTPASLNKQLPQDFCSSRAAMRCTKPPKCSFLIFWIIYISLNISSSLTPFYFWQNYVIALTGWALISGWERHRRKTHTSQKQLFWRCQHSASDARFFWKVAAPTFNSTVRETSYKLDAKIFPRIHPSKNSQG